MLYRHTVFSKLNIHHYLVLDQNVNYNAYSNPLCHEVWNVDHKMVMLGLVCVTINFHIFVCNISIILNMILSVCPFSFTGYFPVFSLINDSMFMMLLRQIFWDFLARLTSFFGVQECIRICESNSFILEVEH